MSQEFSHAEGCDADVDALVAQGICPTCEETPCTCEGMTFEIRTP